MQKFDVIVLGAGSGGLNIASFMNRIGLSVLLIDRDEASIGGDCLNYGCVPSKALIHASRLVADGKLAEKFGVTQQGEVNLSQVMQYVKDRQNVIREHENADYFRKKGMTVVTGIATFTGKRTVKVGEEEYKGKRIVIATGSRPRTLEVEGSNLMPVYTNETIFDATVLPKNLLVVGGGPIGFEIGQAFQRLGSQVTILNRDDQWLGKEHRDVVKPLMETMRREGVRFEAGVNLSRIESENTVSIEHAGGRPESIDCDAVFVSIGRILNLDELGLDIGGIKRTENGRLVLDSYLRTTNKRVFAVGDAAGQHQFTHAAEVHAALVIANFFKPRLFWKKLNTNGMAWVTYTDPEIATFGLDEVALTKRKIAYEVVEQKFADNDRSITDARTEGLARIYVSRKGVVLGGTVVGKDAGELIGELILAQTHGMSLGDIFARVFPYPTASRINRLAAGAFLGKKLTNGTKRLLRFLY